MPSYFLQIPSVVRGDSSKNALNLKDRIRNCDLKCKDFFESNQDMYKERIE